MLGEVRRRSAAGDSLGHPRRFSEATKTDWAFELFFKALKENLKLKSFVGTSENALRIRIWTALIVILPLKWLHHLSKAKWSLSNLASPDADEPVYLPRFAEVAGRPVRDTAVPA